MNRVVSGAQTQYSPSELEKNLTAKTNEIATRFEAIYLEWLQNGQQDTQAVIEAYSLSMREIKAVLPESSTQQSNPDTDEHLTISTARVFDPFYQVIKRQGGAPINIQDALQEPQQDTQNPPNLL